MCGFTITKFGSNASISHRGTEQLNSEWNGWHIEFASLPLSSKISDLKQPLNIRPDRKLVFNGEIFNYKELDPEAISDLDYLNRLSLRMEGRAQKIFMEAHKWEGFWSIVIFDKHKVFFFTDPLGKKQCYFSKLGISSEIAPIVDILSNENRPGIIYDERCFGQSNTPNGSVLRALPGYLYKYDTWNYHNTRIIGSQRYFNGLTKGLSLYDLIDWNVKIRLENRIDNPAIFLSGGLDSNIVLHHVMKYADKNKLEIISIENGEADNVRRIQDLHQVDIKFISDFITEEEKMDAIMAYEHPLDLGSLFPNYILFKELQNSMVLTGDGADELFSGYNRAKIRDTQNYDIHGELPFYHNIRLDRMSMHFTKEARSPLMANSLVEFAKGLNWGQRINKHILRETYKNVLPDFITNGMKVPLRYGGKKTDEVSKLFVS